MSGFPEWRFYVCLSELWILAPFYSVTHLTPQQSLWCFFPLPLLLVKTVAFFPGWLRSKFPQGPFVKVLKTIIQSIFLALIVPFFQALPIWSVNVTPKGKKKKTVEPKLNKACTCTPPCLYWHSAFCSRFFASPYPSRKITVTLQHTGTFSSILSIWWTLSFHCTCSQIMLCRLLTQQWSHWVSLFA